MDLLKPVMLYRLHCHSTPCQARLHVVTLFTETGRLLCRLHSGPDSTIVYAQTGRLYDSAKQYRRAAHYYKLHIMHNFGSGYLPGDNGEYSALLCLAGAYDWDSVATGSPAAEASHTLPLQGCFSLKFCTSVCSCVSQLTSRGPIDIQKAVCMPLKNRLYA